MTTAPPPARLSYADTLRGFASGLKSFVGYQLVTKVAIFGVLLPLLLGAARLLISSTGHSVVTNSVLGSVLMSWQGALIAVGGLAVLLLVIVVELGGFIAISSRILADQPPASIKGLLGNAWTMLRRFADPGTVLLVALLVVVLPAGGIGSQLSVLKGLRIPNFITSVIFATPSYRVGYIALLVLAGIVGFLCAFTMQFVVIAGMRPWRAMRSSARLVRSDFWWIALTRIKFGLLNLAVLGLIIGVWVLGVSAMVTNLSIEHAYVRVLAILAYLVQNLGILAFGVFFVPFEVFIWTRIFAAACARVPTFEQYADDYVAAPAAQGRNVVDRLVARRRVLVPVAVLVLVGLSVGLSGMLRGVQVVASTVEVIGHRGGGNAAPENSLAGIRYAIEQKASWVELDVQRTADGQYVLNHDETFQRVAQNPASAQDLTLAQIKELDLGKGERVPTLAEAIDAANGKIGLALELKGRSADQKMVTDVLQMIADRKLTSPYLLVTLDEALARHIVQTHPTANVGFIYFLQVGKVADLPFGTLILEEGIATPDNVDAIHLAGKRVFVWTVNTPASIDKFVDADVDGVITDEIAAVQADVKQKAERSPGELVWDLLFRLR